MLLYLYDGFYIFRQNNAILMEQLGSFLSCFNVNTVGGESWNVWYRPVCQRVMQRTVMEHYQVHTVFHHSSLHNTLAHRPILYVPWLDFVLLFNYLIFILSSFIHIYASRIYFTSYHERDMVAAYILSQRGFILQSCTKILMRIWYCHCSLFVLTVLFYCN
jgi:hypothetical protein